MGDKLRFGTYALFGDAYIEMYSKQVNPQFLTQLDGADVNRFPLSTVPVFVATKSPSITSGYGCKGLPASTDGTKNPLGRTLTGIQCTAQEVSQVRTVQTTANPSDATPTDLLCIDKEMVLHRMDYSAVIRGIGDPPDGFDDIANYGKLLGGITAYSSGITIKPLLVGSGITRLDVVIPATATWELQMGGELRDFNEWSLSFTWTDSTGAPVIVDSNADPGLFPSGDDPRVDGHAVWDSFMDYVRTGITYPAVNTHTFEPRFSITRTKTYYPNDLMDDSIQVAIFKAKMT